MKHFILLVFLLSSIASRAQFSGEIIYEDKINIHKKLPPEREAMKDVIPEFRTEQMHLIFNDAEAVYKKYVDPNAVVEEDVDMSPNRRRGFRMRSMRSNQILYQNYQDFERIEQREFFDKKFLITGEPHVYGWKMTGETKDVGSYTAQQATYSDSTQSISAWFVPEITVPLGPGEYGQLPGLILYVDINDGERIITAIDIKLRDIEEKEIIKPTKGKEMTQEEFRTMVREKMEERGMNRGGTQIISGRRRG